MPEPLKADVAAADRLLKAAVREALRLIRDGACDYVDQPEDVLAEACRSADLLLTTDQPAKKAAKRAPRRAGS